MDDIRLTGDIDLHGKGIGDEGCEKLVERVLVAIQGGNQIKSIRLSRNNIGDDGAFHLSRLMEHSIMLYLSFNNLTNVGLDILTGAMEIRRKQGLPYGDFCYGHNPGIIRPSFLEQWFPVFDKVKWN